jgi:ATP/ADP translocase
MSVASVRGGQSLLRLLPEALCWHDHGQVFSKGAKFSMFKPAEEMVYIGLDEESRTKGKAAIDVVGAQTGKSLGSVLQQALLLATGGVMAGAVLKSCRSSERRCAG